MKRRQPSQRPESFTLDTAHSLGTGLVFAGLGRVHHSLHYRDSSPYGNHGLLTNMVPAEDWVWNATLNRWGVWLDGSNDFINISNPIAATAATFSFWVRYIGCASATYGLIFGSQADYAGLIFYKATGNVALLQTNGTNINTWNAAWPGVGEQAHFSVTQSGAGVGSVVELIKNGVSLGQVGPRTTTSVTGLRIGETLTAGSQKFEWHVSDFMLHKRVLSLSEIQQLADRSNVMLSGLILPPRRRLWGVTAAAPAATRPALVLGGGVL